MASVMTKAELVPPQVARPRPDALTTEEAADHLYMAPKTLANMRSLGAGPAYLRYRNRVFYLPAALEKWRQQQVEVCEPELVP